MPAQADTKIAAGRELDARVAELFGPPSPRYEIEQHRRESDGALLDWYWVAHDRMPCGSHVDIPHYSTDIADAWKVVEHVLARGFTLDYDVGAEKWHAVIGKGIGRADTAPLAICRAALEAVQP